MNKLGKVAVALAMVFSVGAATAETPAKFVDYVESDGTGGQYVILGDYRPKGDSILIATFSTANRSLVHTVFCARGATSQENSFSVFHVVANGLRFDYGIADAVGSKNVKVDENVKCTVGIDNAAFYLNGTKNANLSRTAVDFTAGGPLMLFASYTTKDGEIDLSALGNHAKMKLYRFRAYDRAENGEIEPKANLWPCVDENGEAGLYDSLSGTIYRSEGGKAFTASETETEGPNASVNAFVSACGDSDWSNPQNWSKGSVPTADDDVLVEGKAVSATGAIEVSSLTLSGAGAGLSLGKSDHSLHVSADIRGDVTIADGATLTVYAGELEDYATAFSNALKSAANEAPLIAHIYAHANIFKIGGDFTVSGGGKVVPVNAVLTGTPVIFKADGDFTLDAQSMFDTRSKGWGWRRDNYDVITYTNGVLGARRRNGNGGWMTTGWNLALGSGQNYSCGGGYGGNGRGAGENGKTTSEKTRNGYAYGYAAAPFLSGAPSGMDHYGDSQTYLDKARGSGSICVLAKGLVTLGGTLNADGNSSSCSCASGGGIWIAGRQVTVEPSALLTAKGKGTTSNIYAPGGGGRIAIVQGASDEELDQLAAGDMPDGFDSVDLTGSGVSVVGGAGTTLGQVAKDGTAKLISKATAFATVEVKGSPVEAVGLVYGPVSCPVGANTFTAPEVAGDPATPQTVRYVCLGFVVSNSVGEVAHDVGTTCTFDVDGEQAPYSVTWLWGNREVLVNVAAPAAEEGELSVGGAAQTTDVSQWVRSDSELQLVVTPAEGHAFNCWQGDVPRGLERAATLALTVREPIALKPFLWATDVVATRNWKANRTGDFFDAANWTEGAVPSPADTAVIASGTCTAKGTLRVGALTLTGGTLEIRDAEDVTVAGDVTMSNSAKWNVYSVPTDATHTYVTGATAVSIGGDLTVGGKATVSPCCDAWTGGAVVFWVDGAFSLALGAKVDAYQQGWNWRTYTGEPSPESRYHVKTGNYLFETMAMSPGVSFNQAASHGGLGTGAAYKVYDNANAPIYPGSPNGVYQITSYLPGGGVVRIHATGKAQIEGQIDASARLEYVGAYPYGGASGGSIWLTAAEFAFGTNALLRAKGGYTAYSYSKGGGGCIAIGSGHSRERILQLAETGLCPRQSKGLERFQQDFPSMTNRVSDTKTVFPIDVTRGSYSGAAETEQNGTFSYYPKPLGLLMQVK